MEPLSITDAASGATALVAVNHGFNCYQFQPVVNGQLIDVIASAPDFHATGARPSGNGTPLLFPFPNRIAAGKYTWDGREYVLPLRPGMPHAIHGFATDCPWRVIDHAADAVTAEFQISRDAPDRLACWPADGRIAVTYRVQGATLRIEIVVTNPDRVPLPFGFGTHTYFKIPLAATSTAAECLIHAPAANEWELHEFIPTGVRRPVSPRADLRGGRRYEELKLDDVLTGLDPAADVHECGVRDMAAGLEVIQRFPSDFRELVAFTPSWTPAVCLEPYTCVTDAVNLSNRGIDAGWRILPPSGEWKSWIEITARDISA
jgi:aldose 1-epimerase